jgi:hypothetical protein
VDTSAFWGKVMELRRCDKCGKEINPLEIREHFSWDDYDNISAIRVAIPYTGVLAPAVNTQGLDDRDEFGSDKFKKREIDLCESCADAFAAFVSNWFPTK